MESITGGEHLASRPLAPLYQGMNSSSDIAQDRGIIASKAFFIRLGHSLFLSSDPDEQIQFPNLVYK